MTLRFGGQFDFDPDTGALRKDRRRIRLKPQAARVLALLATRPHATVTPEGIQKRLWGDDTFIEFDAGINSCIHQIRAALGDDPTKPRFVQTIPNEGYRFVAATEPETSVLPRGTARQAGLARWWKAAAISIGLAGVVYGAWRVVDRPTPRVVLAVLPFENLSGDPDEDYFGDGLTDEIITRLGGLSPDRLGVVAWRSNQPYKTTAESLAHIGEELNADYVLKGSVRREDGRVRVNAQLIRVGDQTHVWAESYEEDLTGVLAVQRDVSRAVAREIPLTLTPQENAELSLVREVDPQAYESYLRGLVSFSDLFTPRAPQVVSHFEQAAERDPEFAAAHSFLALSRALLAFNRVSGGDEVGRAREAAERALELDPAQSEAHVALGFIADLFEWDWTKGQREMERAIELSPGSPWPHWATAFRLSFFGRHDEAIEAMMRARSLDPFNPYLSTCVGEMFWFARRYDEAEREWSHVAVRHPSYSRTHLLSRLMYEGMGDYERALEAYRRNRLERGDLFELVESLRLAYRESGPEGYWRWWFERIVEQRDDLRPTTTRLANLYARLGDMDRAYQYLEQAFEERDPHLVLIQSPQFDGLRQDPRFADFVRRMNFPRP